MHLSGLVSNNKLLPVIYSNAGLLYSKADSTNITYGDLNMQINPTPVYIVRADRQLLTTSSMVFLHALMVFLAG
jgi:hypothetical protein